MDGKEWLTRVGHSYYFSDVRMWIEGDTIVDGESCKKLYTYTRQLWDGGGELLEIGYCRQDGDKYYQNGKLMFDFSLQIGDAFVTEQNVECLITNVSDTILMDGLKRKCLTIRHSDREDLWVEGIGSLSMGLYTNDFAGYGVMKILLSCSYDEDIA